MVSAEEVGKIDSNENFIRLIDQYQNLIFSLCLKLTGDYFAAEDLTQDTFVAAYQHLGEFDGAAEKAWLCRIAGNKCIDYKKAAERRSQPTEDGELPQSNEGYAQGNEPLQRVLNQELMKELKEYCSALPPPYGKIALLHFIEGRTAREISEQTGVGIKTVQTQIYRAREMLRKFYRKERSDE